MRAVRAAVLVASLALGAAGCANALPGTAAYVGADTISVDQVQAQVDEVVAYRTGPGVVQGAPGVRTQLPQITRQVLSQNVLHQLVTDAVARTEFSLDEDQFRTQLASVDQQALLAQPAQLFLTPQSVGELLRDQLTLAQLGRQAWDGLSVTIDLVQGADRADAESLARQLAAGESQAAAVVQDAGANGQQALTVTPATVGAPALLTTPLFSTPAGSAAAFSLVNPQNQAEQWYAVRVNQRQTDAAPPTEPNAVRADQAQITDTLSLGRALLDVQAGEPEIRLNPRYGQWDPTAAQVIPSSDVPSAVVVSS